MSAHTPSRAGPRAAVQPLGLSHEGKVYSGMTAVWKQPLNSPVAMVSSRIQTSVPLTFQRTEEVERPQVSLPVVSRQSPWTGMELCWLPGCLLSPGTTGKPAACRLPRSLDALLQNSAAWGLASMTAGHTLCGGHFEGAGDPETGGSGHGRAQGCTPCLKPPYQGPREAYPACKGGREISGPASRESARRKGCPGPPLLGRSLSPAAPGPMSPVRLGLSQDASPSGCRCSAHPTSARRVKGLTPEVRAICLACLLWQRPACEVQLWAFLAVSRTSSSSPVRWGQECLPAPGAAPRIWCPHDARCPAGREATVTAALSWEGTILGAVKGQQGRVSSPSAPSYPGWDWQLSHLPLHPPSAGVLHVGTVAGPGLGLGNNLGGPRWSPCGRPLGRE